MNELTYHTQFTSSKNDINLSITEGETLSDIVDKLKFPQALLDTVRVSLNGNYILRKYWKCITPKKGTNIQVTLIPQGSDNLRLLAAISIAAFAPGAAAALLPAGVAAGWTVALTIGITVVGMLALNSLFPPPELPELNSSEGSPSLTISGSKNQVRLNQPIPRVYGTVKMFPPYGAQPFTISEGGEQYLYLLFDLGYGPLTVSDLKIGNTSISSFKEIYINIIEEVSGSDSLFLFSHDIDTLSINVGVNDTDSIEKVSSNNIKKVQFDFSFPSGLYGFSSSSDIVDEFVDFSFIVKDDLGNILTVNTDYTINFDTLPFSSINGSVPSPGSIRVKTFTSIFDSLKKKAFSFTVGIDLTYETDFITVTVTRDASSSIGVSTLNTSVITQMRSINKDKVIEDFRIISQGPIVRANHSMIEMRIKATDQLNGIIDSFNCIVSAKLRKWNGSSFDAPAVTDNPAWVYADILTGTLNQRPKNDANIDWDELKRWADFCDQILAPSISKKHTCNFILDYNTTLYELMKNIASIGRATPSFYDDIYSIVFEESKSIKKQIFTNMNSWNFNSSRTYLKEPDGIRIKFKDPDSNWEMREVVAYNDGKNETNSEILEEILSPMTTNSDEAWRNGRYWLKEAILRQEAISISTDIEWLECKRGDFVGVQMDIMKVGGTPARIKSVNGTELVLDTDPAMNGNSVTYFELRPQNGNIISGFIAFYNIGSLYTIDIGVTGASVGDLIVIGDIAKQTYDCLVKRIDVNSNLTANISLLEYAAPLLGLDSDPIPTYNPYISNIGGPNDTPLSLESLTINEDTVIINSNPFISIELKWSIKFGQDPDYFKIFKYNDLTDQWDFEGNTNRMNFIWGKNILAVDNPIIGSQHCFSVISVKNETHLLPEQGLQACIVPGGDTTIPSVPDYFLVEDTAENFRRFWWGYDVTTEPNDLKGFIIRYTKSTLKAWSSATPLHDGILINPPFEIRALPSGAQTVLIRTVDTSGNISITAKEIQFNLGDRIVENVLESQEFAPDWLTKGQIISGSLLNVSNHVDGSNRLTADTSTSGIMWNDDDTILLWQEEVNLMWQTPNDSFKWLGELNIPGGNGGITSIDWVGDGEVKIFYAQGTYPEDYRLINLLKEPRDISNASWQIDFMQPIINNTRTSSDNLLNADILSADTTLSNNHNIQQTISELLLDDNSIYTFSVEIRPVDQKYVYMRIFNKNLVSNRVMFDLSVEGSEIISSVAGNANAKITKITSSVSSPPFYRLSIEMDIGSGVNNPIVSIQIFNSSNNTSWSGIIGNEDFHIDKLMLNKGPLIEYNDTTHEYIGPGQGLIPYTSPVNLGSGDWMVIVDSPKSVDVNRLSSLTWTTDVPDINEVFDDIAIAIGGTVVTFTKTYVKVTAIGLTLQTSGTAVSAKVTAKSLTECTIICYDSSNNAVNTGIVDIRIQGY